MNWETIEELLNRYWEADTNLSEEQLLKEAFSRTDLPAHLLPFKIYFIYQSLQKNTVSAINADEMLFSVLETPAQKKGFGLNKWMGIAAGFLILMSSLFFLLKTEKPKAESMQSLSKEEVLLARKYLNFLARNLDQSITFSATGLEKLTWLNRASNTLQQYENAYLKTAQNLVRVEELDKSRIKLKLIENLNNLNQE
ncbi:MAG TPA: hypothetical protein DCG69_01890 [Bacteroidales bacterium]|nr:hypothetical protein [Bacteroidales bacterium]